MFSRGGQAEKTKIGTKIGMRGEERSLSLS